MGGSQNNKRTGDGPAHGSAKRTKKADVSETEDAVLGDSSSVDSSTSWASQDQASSSSVNMQNKEEDTSGTQVRVKQEVANDDSADEERGPIDEAMFKMEFSVEQEDTSDPQSMTSSLAGVHVKQECVSDGDAYACSTEEHPQRVSSEPMFHCITPGGVEVHIKQEPVSDEETNDPSVMEHPHAVPVGTSFLPDGQVTGLGGMEVRVKQECISDEETGNSFPTEASLGTEAGSLIVPDQIASASCSHTTKIKQETGGQRLLVQDPHIATGSMAMPLNLNQGNTMHTFIVPNMASLGQVMRIVSSSGTNSASNQTTQFVIRQPPTNVTLGNFQANKSQMGSKAASSTGQQMYVASYDAGNRMRVVEPNVAVVQQPQALIQRTASTAQQARCTEKNTAAKASNSLGRPVRSSQAKTEKADKGVQAYIKPKSRTVSVQTSTCVRSMSVQTEEPAVHTTTQTSTASHCTLSLKRDPMQSGPSSSKEAAASGSAAKDAKAPKKYVVSGSSLLQLLDKCQNCLLPVVPEVKVNGTLVEMSAVCAEGHLTTWRNQPSKT